MSSENIANNNALSQAERDSISEIRLVSMGAAASTLSLLIGRDVDAAPASVQEYATLSELEEPFGDVGKLVVTTRYVKGFQGASLLILRIADMRRLTDAMMGPSEEEPDAPLSELQLSAAAELMSQMMNASATGLASLLHEAVEIANPELDLYSAEKLPEILPSLLDEPFVANRLQWLMSGESPIELLEIRSLADMKMEVDAILSKAVVSDADRGEDELLTAPHPVNEPQAVGVGGYSEHSGGRPVDPVTVRPVQFSSFEHYPPTGGAENRNLDLVMDVTLNLSVELGKTELSIKEVLELARGSVIELERVAGEPVDLMANGKLIAKGEVVVIEDNFGLRITSIISPAERLRGL